MDKIKTKLVIIIGGSGGIGSEIAASFLKANHRVCLVYHKNKEQAEHIRSQFVSSCFAYQIDLRSEESVRENWHQIVTEHGDADVVIFAPTAPVTPALIGRKKWEDFEMHFFVQIKGLFLTVQSALDQLERQHKIKFIILLTEYCIGVPPSSLADYISAKYALLGLSKCLAVELAKYGCTVNMISPGMVVTNLLSNLPPKLVEINALKNPLKKLATTKDVAQVALFLASEHADYLNGTNIVINGGSVMM